MLGKTEINSWLYEIGNQLGQGGFGTVYEGTRLSDGLKVAVKYVVKDEDTDYISIPGYDEPIPREVALLTLASKGNAQEIIQLLDWQDFEKNYIMVLERFTPCEEVGGLVKRYGDPDTVKVKLIDFGCGDLLKTSTYRNYMGTRNYTCPEFVETGKYKGNPATVYSLGVLLFIMVCGVFPNYNDLYQMNEKVWCEDGLTTECCSLIQNNPEERLLLENILEHVWFHCDFITAIKCSF
ncbi:serine/threonine-protein kinase pim-3-like [Triplophysa dalaica]|uniref:serine/threonine-protein kinase pim-3-like n=1 Tax=Triplophysa dalaica TaxID=1582913 RepID=UPI0024DFC19C|nr:serine/threonine-protein kinase pim-3-like [Triplophysa dalaica]